MRSFERELPTRCHRPISQRRRVCTSSLVLLTKLTSRLCSGLTTTWFRALKPTKCWPRAEHATCSFITMLSKMLRPMSIPTNKQCKSTPQWQQGVVSISRFQPTAMWENASLHLIRGSELSLILQVSRRCKSSSTTAPIPSCSLRYKALFTTWKWITTSTKSMI